MTSNGPSSQSLVQHQNEGKGHSKDKSAANSICQSNSTPLAIPEILSIVLSLLNKRDILSSITVSRIWNEAAKPVLWKSLSTPPLTPLFFAQLQKNGCHVQSLDLLLNTENDSYTIVPIEFTRILAATPRLTSLSLRLSHGGTKETISSLLKAITSLLANQLESLSLGIGCISSNDACELFRSLTSIKRLQLIRCATDNVMNAVAEAQKDHSTGLYSLLTSESPSTTDVFEQQVLEEPWFGDDTIGLLGLALADLRQITIINNPNLTSAGLIRYSEHFNGLTRLNLECCRSIEPEGFGTLIERSPSLTHIQLGNTQANDQTLFKLSSPPSRASTLKVLSVFRCQGVTNLGIKSIVTFCQNLQSLDFTMCSLVSIDIFDEPTWECSQLETLLMSGISQGADLGTLEVPRPARRRTISATALSSMYKQLGRLKRLRELDIGGMPFDLNLFQMGHRDLEALERLRILRLVNTTKLLTRKEITWLATRFNDLEYLALDKGGVDSELLLQDLMDINPRIRIDRIDRTDTTVPRTVQFPQFDGALPPHDDIDNESEVESHATSDSGHIDTLMDSEPDSYHGMDEDMDSDSHFGASPSNEFVSDSEDELIRLRQEEEEEDEEEHQRILQDDEEELERMRLEEEEEEEELKRLREEEEEEEEEELRRLREEEEEEEEEELRRLREEEEEEEEELRRLREEEEEEEEEELRRLREEEEEEEEEELRRLREEEEEEEAEELRRLREEEEEEAEEELRMQREMEEDEDDTNISGSDGDIYSRQKSSSPDYPSPGNGDLNDADEDMESIDGGPSDAEANASNNQGIDSYSEGSDGSDVEDDDNDEHDSSHFSSDNIDSDDY